VLGPAFPEDVAEYSGGSEALKECRRLHTIVAEYAEADDTGCECCPGIHDHPLPVIPRLHPSQPLLPRPEPAVGGPPGAAKFRWDVLLQCPGGEHEPDHSADDPWPASLEADGLPGWGVMSDGVEELVRQMGTGHGSSLLDEGRLLCPGAESMSDRVRQSL
jgi:hypothetical protein